MTESCEAHEPSGDLLLNTCIAEVKSQPRIPFTQYFNMFRVGAFIGSWEP